MRFRPANIRLINRRSNLPRLLLALSSKNGKDNNNDKNNPTDEQELTGSLHIRASAISREARTLGRIRTLSMAYVYAHDPATDVRPEPRAFSQELARYLA
jgi:hypothetical protein